MKDKIKKCSIDGCDRKYYGRGFCQHHYNKKFGYWATVNDKNCKKCSAPNCNNKYYAKGYCAKHYKQIETHGRLTPELEKRKPVAVDDRFGRLVVLKRATKKRGRDVKLYWLCLCDCGTKKIVRGNELLRGHTKSCGCLRREMIRKTKCKYGIPGRAKVLFRYKRDAKRRKLSFELSPQQVFRLVEAPCFYCGDIASSRTLTYPGEYKYNGIDRVNNELGYVPRNVVSCCHRCNRAKLVMGQQEFLDWVARIANYQRLQFLRSA